MKTLICLVRHGQTDSNLSKSYNSYAEDINENGIKQAEELSEKIKDLKIDIISGKIKPGDKLPSVRDLALQSKVNPNTMQKALQELEEIKLIYSILKPKYAVTLSNYNKAIAQRNILLKDIAFHSELYDTLDIWEDRIAFFASEIVRQRLGYINKLSLYSQDIYNGLSSGKEKLDISYLQHTVIAGDSKQELYENIKNQLYLSRKNDLVTGFTSVGPHRDDLSIKIDGLSAPPF